MNERPTSIAVTNSAGQAGHERRDDRAGRHADRADEHRPRTPTRSASRPAGIAKSIGSSANSAISAADRRRDAPSDSASSDTATRAPVSTSVIGRCRARSRTPNGDTRPRAFGRHGASRPIVQCRRPRRPDEPIVQPRCAALPELESVRHDAHAAPVRRPRHVRARTALGGRGELRLEPRAIRDRRALRRRPCGRRAMRAAAPRNTRRIRRALARSARALDAHLPLELGPEEQQRDARIGRELAALAAVVVRVEHEAARVERPSAARCARRAARPRRRWRASSRSAREAPRRPPRRTSARIGRRGSAAASRSLKAARL